MRIYLRLLVVSLLLFVGNIVYAEAQQEKRVTGTVTSEGEPLPGVSVQLKGASSGTITDIDGKYSIEVLATGTLVFRFVGMRTVEQPVNNRSVINVTLESESKELEEVMVVAYATAKKYSFTGAASTMKAGEIEKCTITFSISPASVISATSYMAFSISSVALLLYALCPASSAVVTKVS